MNASDAAQALQSFTPESVPITPGRPLAVIDVDEVIGLFVQGFSAWVAARGYDLRLTSFALFANLYPAGGETSVGPERGKDLLDRFFAEGCGEIEPAPGAVEGLRALADVAQVVILTNAPEAARRLRRAWLARHAMPYPLILNGGLKGPPVRVLAERAGAQCVFVDDLLPNLQSVAEHAPDVTTFQMVADPVLRTLAPSDPVRHPRIDDWPALVPAAVAALRS